MPEITITHIALLAAALIVGVVVGWIFRGNRGSSEKAAINLGWREQLAAQCCPREMPVQEGSAEFVLGFPFGTCSRTLPFDKAIS